MDDLREKIAKLEVRVTSLEFKGTESDQIKELQAKVAKLEQRIRVLEAKEKDKPVDVWGSLPRQETTTFTWARQEQQPAFEFKPDGAAFASPAVMPPGWNGGSGFR